MNGPTPAIDWRLIGAVLAGLLFFGASYNALIHYLDGRKDGYVALLVVGGVLITLGGVALINWPAAVITLACFAASGTPMVIGDMWRSIKRREAALQALREGHDEQ